MSTDGISPSTNGVSLAGKVAVITGASSGIGRSLAQRLSDLGVRLGLGARHPGKLDLPDAIEVACDVRDAGQVQDLVDRTADRFGHIDILVANAGVGSYHQFLETPPGDIEEMIDTNLKGTIYLYRAGLPHLIERGEGDLITVSSEAGRRGFAGEAVYSASKFGQLGLTRGLDNELRTLGVRATTVCPGGVATNFAMGEKRGRTPESVASAHMLEAEDVSDLIVYVLTRPRRMRVLETALRAVSEASWG